MHMLRDSKTSEAEEVGFTSCRVPEVENLDISPVLVHAVEPETDGLKTGVSRRIDGQR